MKTTAQRINEQICMLGHGTVQDDEFDKPLQAVMHIDSLDMVEIVMALEEEFDIEIPDDEVEDNDMTMYDLILVVESPHTKG